MSSSYVHAVDVDALLTVFIMQAGTSAGDIVTIDVRGDGVVARQRSSSAINSVCVIIWCCTHVFDGKQLLQR